MHPYLSSTGMHMSGITDVARTPGWCYPSSSFVCRDGRETSRFEQTNWNGPGHSILYSHRSVSINRIDGTIDRFKWLHHHQGNCMVDMTCFCALVSPT